MCKDCPNRAPCCWSSCEMYKAERAELLKKKKWLSSFRMSESGNNHPMEKIYFRRMWKDKNR